MTQLGAQQQIRVTTIVTTMLPIINNSNSTTTCPTNTTISTSNTTQHSIPTLGSVHNALCTTTIEKSIPKNHYDVVWWHISWHTNRKYTSIYYYQVSRSISTWRTIYRQQGHAGMNDEPPRKGPSDAMMQQIEKLSN